MDARGTRETIHIGLREPKQQHHGHNGDRFEPTKAIGNVPCVIAEMVTGIDGATCPYSDENTSVEDQATLCSKCISLKTATKIALDRHNELGCTNKSC